MIYFHQTKTQTITARIIIEDGQPCLKVSSKIPFKSVKIDALSLFDMMKDGLSMKSRNQGTRRRALQLNGLSLKEAMHKMRYDYPSVPLPSKTKK